MVRYQLVVFILPLDVSYSQASNSFLKSIHRDETYLGMLSFMSSM